MCVEQFSFYEDCSEILSLIQVSLHAKVPLYFRDVNETSDFLDKFSKNTETFKTIRPVGTEVFHAVKEKDMKLRVALLSSAITPKLYSDSRSFGLNSNPESPEHKSECNSYQGRLAIKCKRFKRFNMNGTRV